MRMYNKLKRHEDIILKPALTQLHDLNDALQRDNPAMLAVNRVIAEESERRYNVNVLQAKGLLDAACSATLERRVRVIPATTTAPHQRTAPGRQAAGGGILPGQPG